MSKILIDTDILIDIARNIDKAIARLKKESKSNQLCISIITQMELIIGCRNKQELFALEKFLQGFDILNIDDSISQQAIQLRKTYNLSHSLLMADCFIAATAIDRAIPLLSKNQKDYLFIKDLQLSTY